MMNVHNYLLRMATMVLLVVVLGAADGWGAPVLTVSSVGSGQFEVRAQDFAGVGGIDMTLSYDPALLGNPRVSQKELSFGAMMTPNLSMSGVVRIGIVTPNAGGISGSGSVALISFTPVSAGRGSIGSFSARVISTKGLDIPVQVRNLSTDAGNVITPAGSSTTTPSSGSVTTVSQGTPATGTVGLGRVTTTLPTTPPPQPSPEPSVTAEAVPAEDTEAIAIPMASEPRSRPSPGDAAKLGADVVTGDRKSVLALFKEYAGPLTPRDLEDLFAQGIQPGVRQEPPVALTDGASKILVFLKLAAAEAVSPNFALSNATLTSLRMEGRVYRLEVLPAAGVNETSVMVLSQHKIVAVPLVVAAPLAVSSLPPGGFTEAAFVLFLKGYAEGKGDLNKDGKTDYLDLYLFTANYCASAKNTALSPHTGATSVPRPEAPRSPAPGPLPAVPAPATASVPPAPKK